jgi:hypothetical protein
VDNEKRRSTMLKTIRSFLTNFMNGCSYTGPVDVATDFGFGYKARQLVDGRWVLEFGKKAVDRRVPFYAWTPDSAHYKDCIFATLEEVQKESKALMASRGV